MLRKVIDHRNPSSLSSRMRRERFGFFTALLAGVPRPLRILDVGGTQEFWVSMGFLPDAGVEITLINTRPRKTTLPGFSIAAGDARCLPFMDSSFEVVFSNSVIEHVGSYADQRAMAEEIRRVGQHYFVQTPNRGFPIEPHFLVPFFQFLPESTRVWILTHFNTGRYAKITDRQYARQLVHTTCLLAKREFMALFPGAALYEERFLGLTKSLVAYAPWSLPR